MIPISLVRLKDAKPGELSFLVSDKYQSLLSSTKASAVIVPSNFSHDTESILLNVDNPDKAFADTSILFYNPPPEPLVKVHSSAVIDDTVLIGKNVKIGSNSIIGSNTIIEHDVQIGKNCVIGANVILRNVLIGKEVVVQDGSKIGVKGFGFIPSKGKNFRFPHIGRVLINDNVEIGANCTIDRGSIGDTVIGKNTFLDNLVHIAHNVKIGENCMIAGQVGFAGSTSVGNNVSIGGQAGVSGHLKIGNNVRIGGGSGVVKNIPDGTTVMGYPAVPLKEFLKKNGK